MKLSKILSIQGKPGLYLLSGQAKNGLLVERIGENKKIPVFSTERVSSLEEISVFTEEQDLPLKDVFEAIKEKCNGEQAISHKSSANELKTFLGEAIPSFDRDRVYASDIKKMIAWYNILQANELLDFEEEEVEEEEIEQESTEEQE